MSVSPSIPDTTALLTWPMVPGQSRPVTFDFTHPTDNEWVLPDGTYTMVGGANLDVEIPCEQTSPTQLVGTPPEDNAALIAGRHWRCRLDGIDQFGGPVRTSYPVLNPGDTADTITVTVAETPTVQITAIIGGGGGSGAAATFRIPMVAQWNPPSLVPGIYPGRVFLFGCAVADITPAPASPFQVIVEAAFAPGTPSDPSADDIPNEDAWFTVQDLENADIYGALLIPLDYLVAPYEAYLPPEFEGSYPFGQPIWYRGRSIDADGFRTVFNMFMPDGIPADPAAFPMVVFADGHKTTVTIDAPADDTSAGDPSEVTVDYEAIGTGLAPVARNVDARIAALEARVAALEP